MSAHGCTSEASNHECTPSPSRALLPPQLEVTIVLSGLAVSQMSRSSSFIGALRAAVASSLTSDTNLDVKLYHVRVTDIDGEYQFYGQRWGELETAGRAVRFAPDFQRPTGMLV